METYAEVQKMTFNEGRAAFVSRFREFVCYPVGNPRTMIVDGQVISIPGPATRFIANRWACDDAGAAAGMIRADLFCDQDGFVLDFGCLPDPVAKIWAGLTTPQKRTVALALVNSVDPEEAAAKIPKDVLKAQEPAMQVQGSAQEFVCPVPGCNLKIEGVVDPLKAKTDLMTHQRIVHPGWQG